MRLTCIFRVAHLLKFLVEQRSVDAVEVTEIVQREVHENGAGCVSESCQIDGVPVNASLTADTCDPLEAFLAGAR